MAGPRLFLVSAAIAAETRNKSQALARKPGMPGIRAGLNVGASRAIRASRHRESLRIRRSHLFVGEAYLAAMSHDNDLHGRTGAIAAQAAVVRSPGLILTSWDAIRFRIGRYMSCLPPPVRISRRHRQCIQRC